MREPSRRPSCRTALWTVAALGLVAASAAAEEPASYTDKIPRTRHSFDMVYIPGGTLQMGSPDAEEGRDADEGPVHAVAIEPFWIGKFEVTWPEYEAFWLTPPDAKNPEPSDAITRPSSAYEPPDHGWGREKNPAMHLTWHSAVHYCKWLSLKTGHAYRLPTEAEWEFACRAGTTSRTFFGDDAAQLDAYAWYEKNSDGKTHPVGLKKPNAFGLHDMLGNVWEYCLNPYTPDYGAVEPEETQRRHRAIAEFDPARGISCEYCAGSKKRHKAVLRGGSFVDPASALRCANRQTVQTEWNARNPQRPPGPSWLTDGQMCGFRLARSVKEEQNNK